jgi:hypothetical protein
MCKQKDERAIPKDHPLVWINHIDAAAGVGSITAGSARAALLARGER